MVIVNIDTHASQISFQMNCLVIEKSGRNQKNVTQEHAHIGLTGNDVRTQTRAIAFDSQFVFDDLKEHTRRKIWGQSE